MRKNILWIFFFSLPFLSVGQGQALFDEAEALFNTKNYEDAYPAFQKSYDAFEIAKDTLGMAQCLLHQGYIHISKFQKDQAIATYQQSADLAKSIGHDPTYLIAIDAISSTYLFSGDTHKAIPLLEEGMQLGIKLDSVHRYSSKMISLGQAYVQIGRLDTAQVLLLEALHIKRKLKDKTGEAGALNRLATLSYHIGDYEKTLDYEQQCLRIRRAQKDSLQIISSYKKLSDVFIGLEDYGKAEQYATQGYQLADHFDLQTRKAACLSNLALINMRKNNPEKALDQYNEVIDTYRKAGNKTMLNDNLLKCANIYLENDKPHKAEAFIKEAHNLAFKIDHTDNKIFALLTYGHFYLHQKKPKAALPLLLEGATIAKEHALKIKLKNISQALAQTYKQLGQYEQALIWQESYNTIVDTIFKEEKQQAIYNLETRYQVNQKEKQIELLQTKDEINTLQIKSASRRQLFLLISLLALTALAGLGFFFYKTKQKDNQLLEEKNKIISQALSDKELLLKEIHHRVKNNLQVISSLLSMQSYQIKDEQALMAVRQGKDRVRSMALIHQNLYQDVNLTSVDSKIYIKKLTQSLFNSYNIDEERITLNSQIDPIKLDVDIMIPLGLILNELISNALKHAFAEGTSGELNVQLHQKEETLELNISDNGVGLPDDFNMEQSESIGYLIVNDFCKKLKATLEIISKNGTEIKLNIPHPVH